MAERFEVDLLREMIPVDAAAASIEATIETLNGFKESGKYREGLALVVAHLDRVRGPEPTGSSTLEEHELRVWHIEFLSQLQRYELAKVSCEQLLAQPGLTDSQRLRAMMLFVICSYRLRRYTIAWMAVEQIERDPHLADQPPKTRAHVVAIRAVVEFALGQFDAAISNFERAIHLYRDAPDTFEACRSQINLASTLIRIDRTAEAEPHLKAALKTAETAGYDKLKALALSHLAVMRYRSEDFEGAETYALRSNTIARPREYLTIVFRNCYYLRGVAERRGDRVTVVQNERTLRSYVHRVDPDVPEVIAYRAEVGGGQR
jgi:tetratricopeptide (TPR) repeat protein